LIFCNIQRFKIQSSDEYSLEQATGTLEPTVSGRPCYILCGDRENQMTTYKNWRGSSLVNTTYGEHLSEESHICTKQYIKEKWFHKNLNIFQNGKHRDRSTIITSLLEPRV